MDVRIPKLDMTTVEVEISDVHIANGQRIAKGDPLITIEGDKSSFELEAEASGTVHDLGVAKGDVKTVGDLICRIEEEG